MNLPDDYECDGQLDLNDWLWNKGTFMNPPIEDETWKKTSNVGTANTFGTAKADRKESKTV